MADPASPPGGPPVEALSPAFHVYETRREGDRLLYFGEPMVSREQLIRQAWPVFRELGYEVTLSRRTGEHVLIAEPVERGPDGVPWFNVILAVATLLSTLYVGARYWYYVPNPLGRPVEAVTTAWPFAAAVLGVLGIHELGHYLMSRHHEVEATLPYFIPMPTIIGTMGAVIRMKGRMPDRRALFDIGVAGPLAGLAATIVVTVIGLSLPPVEVPQWVLQNPSSVEIRFGFPPLLQLIELAVGGQAGGANPNTTVNPVVFGGWVGMFVTFLNLLPVGQLDGGHIVRAILGKRQATVAALVPAAMFGLAGYLYFIEGARSAVGIWVFWGLLALLFASFGSATPVSEEPLDRKRILIGVLTFALGLLCFTPMPFQVVP